MKMRCPVRVERLSYVNFTYYYYYYCQRATVPNVFLGLQWFGKARVLAYISIHRLANVLLAMAVYFNQALTLRCAFSLSVLSYRLY